MKLVNPTMMYKEKYIEYIHEWGNESITPVNSDLKDKIYEALLDEFFKAEHDINLPRGYVPETTYFFVDEADDIIGVVNIRHYLDEILFKIRGHIAYGIRPSKRGEGLAKAMLRLALDEAKIKGIRRVLMVSDKSNIASSKTIQSCGGILENERYDVTDHEVIQRYWIDL